MGYLDLRAEEEFCHRCDEEIGSCCCHLLLCWEGTTMLYGADESFDALVNWGCWFALQGSPPSYESPVLKALPAAFAVALEAVFLNVAAQCGEEVVDDEHIDEGLFEELLGNARQESYAAWVESGALQMSAGRQMIDGGGPGLSGIYHNVEVEDPVETQARMDVILSPALKALQHQPEAPFRVVQFGVDC